MWFNLKGNKTAFDCKIYSFDSSKNLYLKKIRKKEGKNKKRKLDFLEEKKTLFTHLNYNLKE